MKSNNSLKLLKQLQKENYRKWQSANKQGPVDVPVDPSAVGPRRNGHRSLRATLGLIACVSRELMLDWLYAHS